MTTLTNDAIATALFQLKFDGLDLDKRISELYSTAGMLAVQQIGHLAKAHVEKLEAGVFPDGDAPKFLASDLDEAYALWTSLMTRMKEERGVDIADPMFFPKFAVLHCQMVEGTEHPTMLKAWLAHTSRAEIEAYLLQALHHYTEDVQHDHRQGNASAH